MSRGGGEKGRFLGYLRYRASGSAGKWTNCAGQKYQRMLVARFHPPFAGSMRRASNLWAYQTGTAANTPPTIRCGPPPMGLPNTHYNKHAASQIHSHRKHFIFNRPGVDPAVNFVGIAKMVGTL